MKLTLVECGEYVNQSERVAAQRTKAVIDGLPSASGGILLTNFSSSSSPLHQSDELDQVCIGPFGVVLIEVKHWDAAWMQRNPEIVNDEAEKLTNKAKRLGGRLKTILRDAPWVTQALLCTRSSGKNDLSPSRGVPAFTLGNLQQFFKTLPQSELNQTQIELLADGLEPRSRVQRDGRVRRIATYQDLELKTPSSDSFHRVYRGIHQRTKERVVLHLYDLSASDEKEPFRIAEREFRTLQLLQKSRWVPRVRDSLQELANYPGELFYLTLFDPQSPGVGSRTSDAAWTFDQRMAFTAASLEALEELHGLTDVSDATIVHRNLTPDTLLVGARNSPLFIELNFAKLLHTQTLGIQAVPLAAMAWAAPEVNVEGLSAASHASDVYSLCRILLTLFRVGDPLHHPVCKVLERGMPEAPNSRASLSALRQALASLLPGLDRSAGVQSQVVELDAPAAEFWGEGHETPFRDMTLRVVCRLGHGGIGRTFKVEQVDPISGENFGTYVAKVIHSPEAGIAALHAYQRVRSHSTAAGLSVVFETTRKWKENRVVALMKWVDGTSLDAYAGVLPLLLEECGDATVASLIRRWLMEVCTALASLHAEGLVHGDVSPRNLIYQRGAITLTDYDLVTPIDSAAWGVGAQAYCSPEAYQRMPLGASDDFFALAASLFYVVYDRMPFATPNGVLDKTHGLHWKPNEREELGLASEFLDRATHPNRNNRFQNAREALDALAIDITTSSEEGSSIETISSPSAAPLPRSPQEVQWLQQLLSVYPGSPHGNLETRGLDSDFAVATYVATPLEDELEESIRRHEVRLVILCGNAGDGKTALLQHLASAFGVHRHQSSERVWEAQTGNLTLRANLDGAAAWGGQSANELLDEFLIPFADGPPSGDLVHLLAINDGRLLDWIEGRPRTEADGILARALRALLADDSEGFSAPAWMRFISLNHRSLVGGRTEMGGPVSADFLNRLITQLLGGVEATTIWEPCQRCSAWDRCTAGNNAHRLLATESTAALLGERLRERLSHAFQAVHQRGEVHITARELRGVLSYIIFGVRLCRELHDSPGLVAEPYWEMAFSPDTPYRQGELLRELSRLDPALDAHPHLDRWLIGRSARELPGAGPTYPNIPLDSARRRAYFEWQFDQLVAVAGDASALDLAAGEHLRLFREAALLPPEENAALCARILRGISQLENLPSAAVRRANTIPLRITPRTPTETVFWVEKTLDRFRLEAEWPRLAGVHLPVLPRRLRLVFSLAEGREERLPMGYQLFHTLLALADGEQLNELRSDDLFANLTIFTQRLVHEDEANLLGWNPKADETIYRLGVRPTNGRQVLACEPI